MFQYVCMTMKKCQQKWEKCIQGCNATDSLIFFVHVALTTDILRLTPEGESHGGHLLVSIMNIFSYVAERPNYKTWNFFLFERTKYEYEEHSKVSACYLDIMSSIHISIDFLQKISILQENEKHFEAQVVKNVINCVKVTNEWGDKPLSEPIMVSLLMHICVTRPQ